MSSRFKRCKTCGTTNVSDFAPRKSVICKACEVASVSNIQVSQEPFVEKIPQVLCEEKTQNIIKETIPEKSIENIYIENTKSQVNEEITSEENTIKSLPFVTTEEFEAITQKFIAIENNYKLLKEEVEKLNRLKKMFPRMFPEDNPEVV